MAGVTLNQIATRIAGEQGDKKDDTSFISQCETWLKDAMIEIDSEGNFQIFRKGLTITTSASVTNGLYDLPEDYRSMKYLRLVDTNAPIEYADPKVLASYGVDLEQFGTPKNFWISDPRLNVSNQFVQRIKFHPIPNSVLPIDGMYFFDIINVATDSFLPLSQRAILAIESRLRMYITKSDREWTAYNVNRSEYSKNLANFLQEEKSKPSRNLRARYTDVPSARRRSRLRFPWE